MTTRNSLQHESLPINNRINEFENILEKKAVISTGLPRIGASPTVESLKRLMEDIADAYHSHEASYPRDEGVSGPYKELINELNAFIWKVDEYEEKNPTVRDNSLKQHR
jgi:hypothetical protein